MEIKQLRNDIMKCMNMLAVTITTTVTTVATWFNGMLVIMYI